MCCLVVLGVVIESFGGLMRTFSLDGCLGDYVLVLCSVGFCL